MSMREIIAMIGRWHEVKQEKDNDKDIIDIESLSEEETNTEFGIEVGEFKDE